MSSQRLVEEYLARARELENYAQRMEQTPPSHLLSLRRSDPRLLRNEAAWWRTFARSLAKAG